MSKKHAFVKYTKKGKLIPGSLVITSAYPKETANGVWEEVPMNLFCCAPITTTTVPPAFRMLFSNIIEVDAIVGDSSNVSDWNTYFDLPTLGTPFTSVSVSGNEVKLYGGSGIKAKPALMYGGLGNDGFIIELDDQAGCITSVGGDAFSYQYSLTTVNLPACTIVYGYQDSPQSSDEGGFGYCTGLTSLSIPNLVTVGDNGFDKNESLTSINFPLLENIGIAGFSNLDNVSSINFPSVTSVGNACFSNCFLLTSINLSSCTSLGSTVGDNFVFSGVTGNTITLTVPSALMTADAGNPDGDIVYLQANNTVTIVTV